jgi:hypothetical protein
MTGEGVHLALAGHGAAMLYSVLHILLVFVDDSLKLLKVLVDGAELALAL